MIDYLWASGNVAEFKKLLPDVQAILDDQISIFDKCLLTNGILFKNTNSINKQKYGNECTMIM